MNLALDEAIFDAVRARRSPPTLRLYGWEAPTLSLGYAQEPERDLDLAACATPASPSSAAPRAAARCCTTAR